MRSPGLLVVPVLVAATLGTAREAVGACNVIPGPTNQVLAVSATTGPAAALHAAVAQENAKFGGLVPYKGAIGRIDRVLFGPGSDKPILVAADARCVPETELPPFPIERPGDLVAAQILSRPGAEPSAILATGGGDLSCPVLSKAPKRGRLMVGDCKDGGVSSSPAQPNVVQIAFPPAPSDGGAMKIVLLRATSIDAVIGTLERLESADCSSLCGDPELARGVGACIDKVYAPTALTTAQLVVYGAQDMVKCAATKTPSPIPWNTFAAQCTNGDGSTGLPSCQNPPTASTLTMWEDDCFGVYVPLKYDALLGTAPDKYDRQVQGYTAITQKKGHSQDRLWIPGAEFVGTLSEADVTGSGPGFVTDPRRAQLDVWFPTDEEFGIRGIADKPQAILHVVPRLGVTLLCANKPDEACMAVPTVPSFEATRCACRDRYEPDCKCEATVPAKYFQCSTSDMPCTRDAHCNPGELCNKQPTCQQVGDVWKKGGPNPAGPDKCWHDGHCTGSKKQCGFLLFDVRDMRETNKSEVVLDAKLAGSGARKRRGVCKDTGTPMKPNRKVCNNASGNPSCATDEGDCTEYVLQALGGTKLP